MRVKGTQNIPNQLREKQTLQRDIENHKLQYNVEYSFTGNKMSDYDAYNSSDFHFRIIMTDVTIHQHLPKMIYHAKMHCMTRI